MHYCISDIHGEFDRYQAMLEEIHLTDDDTLYVIGDAIDRAPGGIDILEDIMARKNVVMLVGNHEQMCLDTLGKTMSMEPDSFGLQTEAALPVVNFYITWMPGGGMLYLTSWPACLTDWTLK